MKLKNVSTIERALGIIEGVSWVIGEKATDALTCAVEMIDSALDDERKEKSNETTL